MTWTSFVHLDDNKTGGQGRCADKVEQEVNERPRAFLLWRVGGLEDKGCLYGKQKAGLCQRLSMIRLSGRIFQGAIVVAYGVEKLSGVMVVSQGSIPGQKKRELTGCAEKKINLWERMAPHTIAASWKVGQHRCRRARRRRTIQMPACAIGAVPVSW